MTKSLLKVTIQGNQITNLNQKRKFGKNYRYVNLKVFLLKRYRTMPQSELVRSKNSPISVSCLSVIFSIADNWK